VSVDTVRRERDRNDDFAARFADVKRQADGVLLRLLYERGTSVQLVKKVTHRTRTLPNGGVERIVEEVEAPVSSTPALLALCKARMPELFG